MQCSIYLCEKQIKLVKRRLCSAHYARFLRHGKDFDKSPIKNVYLDLKHRFNKYVSSPDINGCMDWKSAKSKKGYGVIGIGSRLDKSRKIIFAHRLSFEIIKGAIPEDMQVCHSCDRPICVNPDHLFLGTAKDNSQDMVKKSRAAMKKGKIPAQFLSNILEKKNAKLTVDKVIQIKKRLSDGEHYVDIAKEYNVSNACISDIKRKATWINI
jgi:uncharacterized protein YerC